MEKSLIKGRSFTAKDQTELGVLLVYIVQTKGECSLQDIADFLKEKLLSRCNINTLYKVAEQLRKRGLLVANFSGSERCYSMGKVKFNRGSNVETAHVTVDGLIGSLVEDVAGIAILAEIRNELNGGCNGRPPKPRDFPCEWGTYHVKMELLEEWLGAIPILGNPLVMAEYKTSPYQVIDFNCDPKDLPLVFRRGYKGVIRIHSDCVRGFFEKHLAALGVSPITFIHFFHLGAISVQPGEGQLLTVYRSPIQRAASHTGGGMSADGAGIGYYEALMPGTIIEWDFDAPTKNFLSLERIRAWLTRCLLRYVRTMSPARGGQTGAAQLLDLTVEKWPVYKDEKTVEVAGA